MDRGDIHVDVLRVLFEKLSGLDGDMGPARVQCLCQIDEKGKSLVYAAVREMDLRPMQENIDTR